MSCVPGLDIAHLCLLQYPGALASSPCTLECLVPGGEHVDVVDTLAHAPPGGRQRIYSKLSRCGWHLLLSHSPSLSTRSWGSPRARKCAWGTLLQGRGQGEGLIRIRNLTGELLPRAHAFSAAHTCLSGDGAPSALCSAQPPNHGIAHRASGRRVRGAAREARASQNAMGRGQVRVLQHYWNTPALMCGCTAPLQARTGAACVRLADNRCLV